MGKRKYWSENETNTAIELYLNKWTFSTIGAKFGRSAQSIERQVKRRLTMMKNKGFVVQKGRIVEKRKPKSLTEFIKIYTSQGFRTRYSNGIKKTYGTMLLEYNRHQIANGDAIVHVDGITNS